MAIPLAHIGQGHYLEPSAARGFMAAQQAAGFAFPLTSGFRTVAQQARLYKQKKGIVPVAPPGKSKHNFGLAVDVNTKTGQGAIQFLRTQGPRFGWYPIKSESWHFEYRGPRAGGQAQARMPRQQMNRAQYTRATMLRRHPQRPQMTMRRGGQAAPAIVQNVALRMGVPPNEIPALMALVKKESGFRPTAQNPTSTAFGLFQFLNSTWKTVGMPKTADPVQQTIAGLKYIKQRYGSPSAALAFHRKKNWY